MWTPTALGSEAYPAAARGWRVVEHQYTISTRKIVDTKDEQNLLEDILEETKPNYPPEAAHLHYLLKTPFRYPPSPYGSRFRRPFDGRGVFYCAEAIRSALAEFTYWRKRFFNASPGIPLPRNHESLTVFSVQYGTDRQLDLTRPPLVRDRKYWIDADNYSATQALADAAREAGIEVIRYESVRDPKHGANLALLSPKVFTTHEPLEQQTWYLYLASSEANCVRDNSRETFTFFPGK